MSSPLTLTGSTFDTAGSKFGSAALSGGYGVMGYSGVQAFLIYGMTFECWTKGTVVPTSQKFAIGCSGFAGLGCDASGNVQFSYTTTGPACPTIWCHAPSQMLDVEPTTTVLPPAVV